MPVAPVAVWILVFAVGLLLLKLIGWIFMTWLDILLAVVFAVVVDAAIIYLLAKRKPRKHNR